MKAGIKAGFFLLLISLLWVINLLSRKFKLRYALLFKSAVKTRLITDMTLTLVNLDFKYQAVLIAVYQYLTNFLDMTAFLALLPKFLTAPAVKYRITGFDCQL